MQVPNCDTAMASCVCQCSASFRSASSHIRMSVLVCGFVRHDRTTRFFVSILLTADMRGVSKKSRTVMSRSAHKPAPVMYSPKADCHQYKTPSNDHRLHKSRWLLYSTLLPMANSSIYPNSTTHAQLPTSSFQSPVLQNFCCQASPYCHTFSWYNIVQYLSV